MINPLMPVKAVGLTLKCSDCNFKIKKNLEAKPYGCNFASTLLIVNFGPSDATGRSGGLTDLRRN
jgi:hypothetical protein